MRSLLICILLLAGTCAAQEKKSRYNLFKPVPRSEMGEMQNDRPDVTENAHTVPAGHFQVETDLFKHTRNTSEGVLYTNDTYFAANLKLGVLTNTDIQLVVPVYEAKGARDLNSHTFTGLGSRFGDITLRVKQNLWGNKGKTAFAVMPFISLGTDNGPAVPEFGVILPFAAETGGAWSFSAQTQFALAKEQNTNPYTTEWLNSVALGRDISSKLSGFVEAYHTYHFSEKQFHLYADAGLVYSLSDSFCLDAGLNYGLTKGADKVYFVGFSFRY